MNRLWLVPALVAFSIVAIYPQANLFTGRWDFTVTTDRDTFPQWMEVIEKDGGLQARIQPRGGAVRPFSAATIEGSHLLIAVSPARDNRPATLWDLTANGDKLTGVQKSGETTNAQLVAVRAPELKRPMPAQWTAPEPIFNGKDLSGWTPQSGVSHWVAQNGELVNAEKGANIRTTRTFDDFKLHIEVNCPEHCNSGIFLRGRYEVQIGTEGGTQPSHEMGAIYGYFAPARELPMGDGEWQVFDITLVGRTVSVVRNGVTIHDRIELPGITGGALDSHEGQPGPFFLQGDHTGGLRYRNITISLPKK
jgi:hypothetical protein